MQDEEKIKFSYSDNLIMLFAKITGKNTQIKTIRCAVDTACGHTTVRTDIIDSLGYSLRDAEQVTNVISSSGEDKGYLVKVENFGINNIDFKNLSIDAFDLPDDIGIDCLIGNDILSKFKVIIDYKNETLELI